MKPPVTIGHEFVGKVLKVNKGTGRVQEGDIVSAESHVASRPVLQRNYPYLG